MNKLIIIGAGGHGRVIADNALKNGYTDICFVDDNAVGDCMGFPVVGKCADIDGLNDGNTDFVIGVGNNALRMALAEKYNVNWVSIIHPTAVIGTNVSIGEGSVVMAGAIINPCATVGRHAIINTGAIIEHDNRIGDYAHVSPGAKLAGNVCVGDRAWVCVGASVINNICICADAIIGAGAAVTKAINEKGTYVGVPARKIK